MSNAVPANALPARRVDFRKSLHAEISSSTYSVHGIDKYPAKLIPQAARYLLRNYASHADTILDPFCGTGSVLVEARLCGMRSVGVDLNPLAVLLASVKTTRYSEEEIDEAIAAFRRRVHLVRPDTCYDFLNAGTWFAPEVLRALAVIQRSIVLAGTALSEAQRRFLEASLVTIVRRCSRADTRGPKPFISKTARRLRRGTDVDPVAEFLQAARFMRGRLLEYAASLRDAPASKAVVLKGDARTLGASDIAGPVDAVVTSPPYINAQDYFRSSKLELRIARLMPESEMLGFSRTLIGTDRGRIDGLAAADRSGLPDVARITRQIQGVSERHAGVVWKYFTDMRQVFRQLGQVVVPGGRLCIVVGTNFICGIDIPTHTLLASVAEAEGFVVDEVLVDVIQNRHVPPQRQGHKGVIRHERALVMTAPAEDRD